MKAIDLAAVVACGAALLTVAGLGGMVLRMRQKLAEVSETLDHLRAVTLPALEDAQKLMSDAAGEAARIRELIDAAESVSNRMEGASKVAYVAISKPVIKTAAAAAGAQRAARRLRGRSGSEGDA